jgi:hypothetical protein
MPITMTMIAILCGLGVAFLTLLLGLYLYAALEMLWRL